MASIARPQQHERVYRRYLPFVLVKLSVTLLLAIISVALGSISSEWWLLVPAALLVLHALYQVWRYHSEVVILRGCTLYLRCGLVFTTEVPLALWHGSPTYAKSWLGRMLDYGTVIIAAPSGSVQLAHIGRISDLQHYIETCQTRLLSQQARF